MMRRSSIVRRDIRYLFIDGAYLDAVMRDFGRKFWKVDNLPIDFEAVAAHGSYQKVFYYNCPPPQASEERESDWELRVRPYFERMEAIGELAGFHVFEGTTKRHRKRGTTQKEVDVQIAVDLLTNSFMGNMEFATLLAGDQDFRPVVEAVVREGMYITLWTEKTSSSEKLRAAADAREYLEWHHLNSFVAKDFSRPYELPTFLFLGGTRLTSVMAEADSVDGNRYVMTEDNGRFFVYSILPDKRGRIIQYIHTDREDLEFSLRIICGIDGWRPFGGDLPLAIGNI